MTPAPGLAPLDPFDLPDWLGDQDVVWTSVSGLRSGPTVTGELSTANGQSLACDLLAVDAAYPASVASEEVRHAAHQAWQYGEVHLVDAAGRPTLAVPGTGFDADRVLDAVGRLARAVGASARRYAVQLRIGG